jgi:transcriptional regulator with XRE-family HTH domain
LKEVEQLSKESLVTFLNSRMQGLGMSKVRDLAKAAKIDDAQASRLLNPQNKEIGSYETLIKVAGALKVRPGALLDAYAEMPMEPQQDIDITMTIDQMNEITDNQRRIIRDLLTEWANKQEVAKTELNTTTRKGKTRVSELKAGSRHRTAQRRLKKERLPEESQK